MNSSIKTPLAQRQNEPVSPTPTPLSVHTETPSNGLTPFIETKHSIPGMFNTKERVVAPDVPFQKLHPTPLSVPVLHSYIPVTSSIADVDETDFPEDFNVCNIDVLPELKTLPKPLPEVITLNEKTGKVLYGRFPTYESETFCPYGDDFKDSYRWPENSFLPTDVCNTLQKLLDTLPYDYSTFAVARLIKDNFRPNIALSHVEFTVRMRDENVYVLLFPAGKETVKDLSLAIRLYIHQLVDYIEDEKTLFFPNYSCVKLPVPLWFYERARSLLRHDRSSFGSPEELIRFFISTNHEIIEETLNDFLKFTNGQHALLTDSFKTDSVKRKISGQLNNIKNLIRRRDNLEGATPNDPRVHLANDLLAESNARLSILQDELEALTARKPSYATITAHPSMMQEQPEEVPVIVDQSTNTIIATTDIEPVNVVVAAPPDTSYLNEIISDEAHRFPGLTDRWVMFRRIPLTATITAGQILAQIHLPADFVIPEWDTPNSLPFRSHEWFTGSLKLKFAWNIPKTNQLFAQIGVNYHWLQRDRRGELLNAHTISQMPGGQLNGHVSNSCEVNVPFMSYLPMIGIRPNSWHLNLYYASVFIQALTPYQISTGGVSNSELLCYAKFEKDLQFFGQRHALPAPTFTIPPVSAEVDGVLVSQPIAPSILPKNLSDSPAPIKAHPSMMAAAAAVGSSLLGDLTRGVASSVVGAANTVVKKTVAATTSTLTNVVEKTVSQALPAKGKNQNRDKATEFSNHALHQRAMTNIASGSGHFSCDSLRLQTTGTTPHPDFLTGVEKFDELSDLCAVQGFIGALTFRVTDVAGTQLGQIYPYLAANPFNSGNTFPNQGLAWTPADYIAGCFRNYHGKVHFHFKCIADGLKTARIRVVYAPSNASGATYDQTNSMYYKIFDLGADLNTQQSFDFICPYIIPSQNFPYRSDNGENHPIGGILVYVETPISMPAQLVDQFQILVYKSAPDVVFTVPRTSFTSFKVDTVGVPDPPPTPVPARYPFFMRVNSVVLVPGTDNYTATVGVYNSAGTQLITITVNSLTTGSNLYVGGPTSIFSANTANLTWTNSFTTRMVVHLNASVLTNIHTVFVTINYLNGVETFPLMWLPAGGARVDWSFDFLGTNPTWFTTPVLMLEGEPITSAHPSASVTELEDLPLVQAHPSSMDVRFEVSEPSDTTHALTPMDSALMGETHDSLLDNVRRFEHWTSRSVLLPASSNLVKVLSMPLNLGSSLLRYLTPENDRTNFIIMLHDAFRFYRGSLRHVITATGPSSLRDGVFRLVHVPQTVSVPLTAPVQFASGTYTNHRFGETIWSIQQNNVISVEYPMYVPNSCLLNASYTSDEYQTNLSQALGTLEIYWQGPESAADFTFLRALGDDGKFYGFNGFPIRERRFPTVDVPYLNAVPSGIFSVNVENSALNGISKDVTRVAEEVSDFIRQMTGGPKLTNQVLSLVLQTAHVIVNPKPATFALSLGQILLTLELIDTRKIHAFSRIVTNYWTRLVEESITPPVSYGPVQGTPSAIDSDGIGELADLSALLVTGVCSLFSVSVSKAKGFPEKFACAFTTGASLHVRMLDFIKAIFNFCKRVVVWILKCFFPESKWLNLLQGGHIEKWIRRANILCDKQQLNRIRRDAKAIAVLYLLVEEGEEIAMAMPKDKTMTGLGRELASTLTRLRRVRDVAGAFAYVPLVKRDPFVLYLHGASSIGKSHILRRLAFESLARHFPELQTTDPIYIVPTVKHWESYYQHPVICFDDFNRVVPQDITESNSAHLCDAKGPAQFCVPKAFEDKGAVSVAELITCASNFAYPHINGIENDVVWNRRNLVFHVLSDFSEFLACPVHEISPLNPRGGGVTLHCASCRLLNLEGLKKFKHLKFLRMSPIKESEYMWEEKRSFDETLEFILEEEATYYRMRELDIEEQLKQLRELTKDPKLRNGLMTNINIKKLAALLDEDDITEFMASLGEDTPVMLTIEPDVETLETLLQAAPVTEQSVGAAPASEKASTLDPDAGSSNAPIRASPAMMGIGNIFGKWNPWKRSIAQRFYLHPATTCQHGLINLDMEASYTSEGYMWYLNGEVVNSLACVNNCVWEIHEPTYLYHWAHKYDETEFPPHFPRRYNIRAARETFNLVRDELKRVEERDWYLVAKKVAKIALLGVTVLGAAYALYSLVPGKVEEPKPTSMVDPSTPVERVGQRLGQPDWTQVREEVIGAHACMMASGDVKTKFHKRLQNSRVSTRMQSKPHLTTPSSQQEDELKALKKCIQASTIHLRYRGTTANCIAVNKRTYLTQLHSFCAVLVQLGKDMHNDFTSGVGCDSGCQRWSHSDKHRAAVEAREDRRMVVTRIDRRGTHAEYSISYTELFDQNPHGFSVDSQSSDLAMFNLNIQGIPETNISKHLNNDADTCLQGSQFEVYKAARDLLWCEHQLKSVKEIRTRIEYSGDCIKHWTDVDSVLVMLDGYVSENPTKSAEDWKESCGSMLIDKTNLKILGLISATTAKNLYFNALSLQMFYESHHLIHHKYGSSESVPLVLKAGNSKFISVPEHEQQHALIGHPSMRVHHTMNTTIEPSVCHEVFGPVVRAPCNLSQNGDRGQTAVINGLANYVPHESFPLEDLELIREDLLALYMTKCRPQDTVVSRRCLEHAVCGIEGSIGRIAMSTSPGFPWCCKKNKKKKSDLLSIDPDTNRLVGIDPELYEGLVYEESMMDRGHLPLTIYQISLKDERLPLEKLNNVRLIQGSPLTLTLSARRLLMDFNLAFQQNNLNLEHCVGINVYSLQWDDLAKRLNAFSPYICVGDYSKFGPRLLSGFVTMAYEIMNAWYTKFSNPTAQDILAREVLGKRANNSINLTFDQYIQLECGSPSGAINTVVVNSMANQMYIRAAWIGIMREKRPELAGLHNFAELVLFYCYGDDVIFAVKPEIIEIFNNESIGEYFSRFNVKYTDVTKDGTIRPFCSIEEATFLKCGFKKYRETSIPSGVWICQPNKEDLYDTCNWVRRPKGRAKGDLSLMKTVASINNAEDAIRRMWSFGKKEFGEFQQKVRDFFERVTDGESLPRYYTFEGLQQDYGIPLPRERPDLYESSALGSAGFQKIYFDSEALDNTISPLGDSLNVDCY